MVQAMLIIVISLVCFSFVIFLVRTPGKVMKFIGNSAIHMTIAVLLLFFFNIFAANFGWHIPINIFTVIVTSILGVFGMGTLLAIHLFIL